MSKRDKKWYLSWLDFLPFSWNYLKSFNRSLFKFVSSSRWFFLHYKGFYFELNGDYIKYVRGEPESFTIFSKNIS